MLNQALNSVVTCSCFSESWYGWKVFLLTSVTVIITVIRRGKMFYDGTMLCQKYQINTSKNSQRLCLIFIEKCVSGIKFKII